MPLTKDSPAYPSPGVVLSNGEQKGAYEGMTQRAAFAVGALSAAVLQHRDESSAFIARKAVELADALMEALNG